MWLPSEAAARRCCLPRACALQTQPILSSAAPLVTACTSPCSLVCTATAAPPSEWHRSTDKDSVSLTSLCASQFTVEKWYSNIIDCNIAGQLQICASDTWGAGRNGVLTHHITPLVYPSTSTSLFSAVCLCAIWSSSDLWKPQYEVIGQRFLYVWSWLNRTQAPRTACLILSWSPVYWLAAGVREDSEKWIFIQSPQKLRIQHVKQCVMPLNKDNDWNWKGFVW